MADCCASNQAFKSGESKDSKSEIPKKYPCPKNGKSYASVPLKTLYQHLFQPWQTNFTTQNYYFCSDPHCEVIYYGLDDSIFTQNDLRTPVGIKDPSAEATLCYCFDVRRKDYAKDPSIKDYVVEKTQSKQCACDVRNPSGKCCLKDFK